ncbi:MAG: hypothetical protein QXH17_01615 [Candidatus Bathyarchaeia archaeon]
MVAVEDYVSNLWAGGHHHGKRLCGISSTKIVVVKEVERWI